MYSSTREPFDFLLGKVFDVSSLILLYRIHHAGAEALAYPKSRAVGGGARRHSSGAMESYQSTISAMSSNQVV
jgi:hypothetical protein